MANGMARVTVLVIEDNHDILEAVRLLLEMDGFAVVGAAECFSGMECLESSPPDVIVTDIGLPAMTGLEFIRYVRAKSHLRNIPIVAMSGYDQAHLIAAVKAGADAALSKPEGLEELTATISSLTASGCEKTTSHLAGRTPGWP